jgi:hypothetical protein
MTKDEALKMAIEAMIFHTEQTRPLKVTAVAIQACKDALDKTQDGDCCTEGCIKCDARCLPTQEPVAWQALCGDNHYAYGTAEIDLKGYHSDFWQRPLYTHPKQWQGLSDDEIWDIANFLGKNKEWDYPVMFAKTIEKVLREKNT